MKPSQQHPLVLVVDGEADILEKVASVLGRIEIECQCCDTAEAAMALAEQRPPDLIISDVSLHGDVELPMSDRIKASEALKDIPVMFLSSVQVPDIIRRNHEDGGSYYLRKPFDADVLLELVNRAIRSPQLTTSGPTSRPTRTV